MNERAKKTGLKTRYIALVLFALTILFLGASLLFLRSQTGRGVIKKQIQSALKSTINGDLEFEIEEGSIIGSVVLKDVSLWTKERDFVASAPRISASYNPLGFFGGRIVVDNIESENLIFAIENKDGESTISGLFLSNEEKTEGANLQIDLSKISLKKCFFVSFSSTKEKRPFKAKEKITVATLQRMQTAAKGPGKLEGGVGAVILGDINANLIVNIDTNGGTNIRVEDLRSNLSIDEFLTKQPIHAPQILLSFFDGEMGLESTALSIGKKASTKSIRFRGHFPNGESEDWFDEHNLEVENLVLSRGYLHVLSEFQLNPKQDPTIEFESQGGLPNRMRYATKIKIADTLIESIGEVEHLLDDNAIKIDSIIDLPFIQATDVLPIDTKIQGRAKLKITGEFTEQPNLTVQGFITDADIMEYHFERAVFTLALAKGILAINPFHLQWGGISGELSGQISDNGPFSLSLLASAEGKTSAKVNMNASGSIDWEAPEVQNLLQTLDAKGDWDVNAFASGPMRIKQSRGRFDIDLKNPKGCKPESPESEMHCYPKNLNLRLVSSGSGVRLKNDYVSRYGLDVDMRSKITKAIDLEAILSALSGNFKIDVASAKYGKTRIEKTKAEGSIKAKGKDRFAYQVNVTSAQLKMNGQEIRDLKADATGDFKTNQDRTSLQRLTSKGKLELGLFTDESNLVRDLDATFHLRKTTRNLRGEILFNAEESTVAGREFSDLKGKADLDKNSTFEVSINGYQNTPKEKDAEKKKVKIRAKGSYRDGFRLDELDLGDKEYQLKNSVQIKNDHFIFDDVRIIRKSQEVKIDGDIRKGRSQDLKVELTRVQLSDLSKELGIESMEPYQGEVTGNIEVAGTASSPTGQFNVSVSDFYYGEIGPIDARVSGRYEKEQLFIDTMKVDFFKEVTLMGDAILPVSITQDGALDWHFDRPISSQQKILSFNCGDLVDRFAKSKDLEISGKTEATFVLSGTLNDPFVDTQWRFEKLRASGILNEIPVELGPFNGNLSANHEPEKTSGAKFTSSLRLESDIGSLLFSASSRATFSKMIRTFLTESILPDFRELDFEMGIRTHDFKIQKLQIGPLVDANAEGLLDLSADFQGSLNQPNVGGKITLNGFGWNRFRDFEFYTAFNFNPKALSLGGTRLGWDGSQILTASAEIPNPISLFSENRKLDESPLLFRVDFIPFELKKLSTFDYKFASLSGVLEGNISANGSFRELKFNSQLTVKKLIYGDGKLGETNMNIRLEDERLSIDAAVLRAGDNASLDISVPFTQNFSEALTAGTWVKKGNISGHIQSKNTPLAGLVPATIYKDYLENLKGSLFSDITIGGSTERPDFKGGLKIENAAFTVRDYGRRFEEVGLVLAFANNTIGIESIHAKDGTGSIQGSGIAVVEDWKIKSLKADFEAKRFSIDGFASVPAFISANAKVSGDFSQSSVRSQVDISGLKIVLPENENSAALATQLDEDIIIIEDQSEELSDLSRSNASIVDQIYAKLKVHIADGEIIHPIANVHFLGDLDIDLANIGALISGDIKTTKGKVETFGKVFEVQPGIVSFRGLDPPNPFLELEAHYKLSRRITDVVGEASSGQARAIVRITGPVYDSKQQYSADPQMSESDVLYILITDQAPGSAGVGQAEAGLALGAASTGLTGIATMIVGSANKVLPDIAKVDVVRVEAGQTEGKVEVGKYLSKKLFVLYRYRFGSEEGESQHEVTFEYRFLPAWILDFQVGDADQGEANLLWDIY